MRKLYMMFIPLMVIVGYYFRATESSFKEYLIEVWPFILLLLFALVEILDFVAKRPVYFPWIAYPDDGSSYKTTLFANILWVLIACLLLFGVEPLTLIKKVMEISWK